MAGAVALATVVKVAGRKAGKRQVRGRQAGSGVPVRWAVWQAGEGALQSAACARQAKGGGRCGGRRW